MAKQKSATERVMDLLRTVPLFSTCSKKEFSLMAQIAEEQEFGAGNVICREGDTGLGLYVIMQGETEIKVGGQTQRRLGPGAFFGEIALLDGGPRTATVIAETDVRLLTIPAWSFNAVLKSQPTLAIKMLQEVCRRMRADQSSIRT